MPALAAAAFLCSVLAPLATSFAQAPAPAPKSEPAYDLEIVQEALALARDFEALRYPTNEPPDGKWFTSGDEEFYVSRISKAKTRGLWKRIDDNQVALAYGLRVQLADETEEDLYVVMPRPRQHARTPRSQGDATAGSQVASWGDESRVEAQRLQITASSFDAGLPTSGRWRNDMTVFDVNGDGHLDIIHGPPRKAAPRPHIFLGDGKGAWTDVDLRFRGGRLDYGDVGIADFDADGHLDLALAMHLVGTTIGYGRGNYVFQERPQGFDRPDWARPSSRFGKRAPWSSRSLEVADIDGDGDLDLIALGEGAEGLSVLREKDAGDRVHSPGITVYLNNGKEPFEAVRFTKLPNGGTQMAVGNFDGDPELEVLAAWGQNNGTRVIVDFDWSGEVPDVSAIEPTSLAKIENESSFVHAVGAGDIISGGVDEILIGRLVQTPAGWQSRLELHAREDGKADGDWSAYTLASWPTNERILDIEAGDIDGDGHLDVVATTNSSRVVVVRNSGKGTFFLAQESLAPTQFNCSAYSVALADLSGDGASEIIVGFSGESTNIPGVETIRGCPNNGRISAWHIDALTEIAPTHGEASQLPPVKFGFQILGESNEESSPPKLPGN